MPRRGGRYLRAQTSRAGTAAADRGTPPPATKSPPAIPAPGPPDLNHPGQRPSPGITASFPARPRRKAGRRGQQLTRRADLKAATFPSHAQRPTAPDFAALAACRLALEPSIATSARGPWCTACGIRRCPAPPIRGHRRRAGRQGQVSAAAAGPEGFRAARRGGSPPGGGSGAPNRRAPQALELAQPPAWLGAGY